jgi:hypothetical protein
MGVTDSLGGDKMATLSDTFTPNNKPLIDMTYTEKIDEICENQRKTLAFITAIVKAMGANPMMRAMMQQNGIEV